MHPWGKGEIQFNAWMGNNVNAFQKGQWDGFFFLFLGCEALFYFRSNALVQTCGIPAHCLCCLFLFTCAQVPGQGCKVCMIVLQQYKPLREFGQPQSGCLRTKLRAGFTSQGTTLPGPPCQRAPTSTSDQSKPPRDHCKSSCLDAWRISELSHFLPGGEVCLQHCVFSPLCTDICHYGQGIWVNQKNRGFWLPSTGQHQFCPSLLDLFIKSDKTHVL